MATEIQLIGGEYSGKTKAQNPTECRNLVVVPDYANGKPALVCAPGLKPFLDTATKTEIRGMHEMNGVLFIVAGDRLFSYNTAGSITERTLGDKILTTTGRVTMASNDTTSDPQLMICDGTHGYAYRQSTGELKHLSEATSNYMGGGSCAFLNGKWLYTPPSSSEYAFRFYWSELNDAFTHKLEYVGVQEPQGDIVRICNYRGEIVVFKKKGMEFYDNMPGDQYEYRRRGGTQSSIGLHTRDAIADICDTLFWLGDDLMVYQLAGYQPSIVSVPSLTEKFESYPVTSDANAIAYEQNGRIYFQLNFKTQGITWLYDAANKIWTSRSSYQEYSAQDGVHRANCYVRFDGKHLVGDYRNGIVYQLDEGTFLDNYQRILRKRIFKAFETNQEWVSIAQLEITGETGTALLTGQGSDPQIGLRYSYNNGHKWSRDRLVSLGATGERGVRMVWNSFGACRNPMTFELTFSDPVQLALTGAYVR